MVATNENAQSISIETTTFADILQNLKELKTVAGLLLDLLKKTKSFSDNSLLIKLPKLKTFEDLAKVANDFKLAIDIPLHEIGEDVTLEKAEEGSIWLTIVAAAAGLKLLSSLVSAGLRIAKANAEMKWHLEQSRTIGLKNDLIASIVEAQKKFIKQSIEDEAVSIFSEKNPESLDKYKLSIDIIADLIDRGSQIQPGKIDDPDIRSAFPDFKETRMIAGADKRLNNR